MATKITTRVLADDAVTDAKIADVTLTTATQSASDNTTKIATTAYVTTAIANLADSAPSTLNTLNELAAALGDDANFSTTVTNSIAAKLPLAGGTLTGALTGTTAAFNSGTTNTAATFTSTDAGSAIQLTDPTGSSKVEAYGANLRISVDDDAAVSSSAIQFRVDGSTKATIESSGSLLVGTTTAGVASSSNVEGIQIAPTTLSVARSGGQVAFFNRQTNDGDIVDFRKDGSTVGSIGANGGYIYVGSSDTNLRFHAGADAVLPANAGGASRSAAIDLGTSGAKFKDLHLSGTANAGAITVDVGAPSSSDKTLGLFQSQSSRQIGFVWDDSASTLGIATLTSQALAFHVGGNSSEKMRIDSSGNVTIGSGASNIDVGIGNTGTVGHLGRTGSGALIHLGGDDCQVRLANSILHHDNSGNTNLYLRNHYTTLGTDNNAKVTLESGTLVFATSTAYTERMRILAGGDVCIGKTSNDINTQGFHVIGAGTYSGTVYSGITGSTAGSTYHVRDTTNNTWKFYVENNGTIRAISTSISSLSDERLKENILDLDTGLTEIMALKPRRFDWKEGEGSGAKNVAGFVAQEVETVLPDLISNFMHDNLSDAKSVKMGDILPTLVKAMQEQQTLIEALTARITTLEG